jgi:hypothetical protein
MNGYVVMKNSANINFTSRIAGNYVLRAFVYVSKFPSHGFYARYQQAFSVTSKLISVN